jgi:TRAP-type C4-dicarboxylate transport system substrate-binding protein
VLLATALTFSSPANAAHVLRLGTLAPRNSTWGKALAVWEKVVETKTANEVGLEIYYNAVQAVAGRSSGATSRSGR